MDKIKSAMRNIHNIDYTRTKYPPEYEKIENKYRVYRNKISELKDLSYKLIAYEYGGHTYKSAMEKLKVIDNKFDSEIFKNESFYKKFEVVCSDLSLVENNGEITRIGDKMARAFNGLENCKIEMNNEIQTQILSIKEMEAEAKNIDKRRVEGKNLRYDLEKMYHKTSEDDPKLCEMKSHFESHVNQVLEDMKRFCGGDSIMRILKAISKSQSKFGSKMAELFSNIQ